MDFTCLLDIRCALGESPVLDDRRKLLFFVDVMGPAIHAVRLDGTGLQTWPMPKPVGSIGLAESGRLLNGTGNFLDRAGNFNARTGNLNLGIVQIDFRMTLSERTIRRWRSARRSGYSF